MNDWAFKDGLWYVSFPPGPAAVMLPFVAVSNAFGAPRNPDGTSRFNDVLFTLFFAALNAALVFEALRLLQRRGHSERSVRDDLLLTALFAFGTVALSCSIIGQVWFTAQVMGVTFTLLFFMASVDGRYPALAGLFIVLGFATRTPVAFAGGFFLLQIFYPDGLRDAEGRWLLRSPKLDGETWRKLGTFAVPIVAVLALLAWHNMARFGDPTEFGHRYLYGIFHNKKIATHGLASFQYLGRNLSAALTLLPSIKGTFPYVQFSRHGLSLLITTPAFALLLWPARRSPLALPVALAALCVALPSLLYQNTGFEQFGYRFSLDYSAYFIVLLALGGRELKRGFIALLIWAMVVNAFGAITFKRMGVFYYGNASARSMFPTD